MVKVVEVAKWVLQKHHHRQSRDRPHQKKVGVQHTGMRPERVQKYESVKEEVMDEHKIHGVDLLVEAKVQEELKGQVAKVEVEEVQVMRKLDLPGRHQEVAPGRKIDAHDKE